MASDIRKLSKMSGNIWPAVSALAAVAGVVVAILALDSAPNQSDPENFIPQPGSGTATPKAPDVTLRESTQKTQSQSPSKPTSNDIEGCLTEATLELGSPGIKKVEVGECWKPCDGVKVVVEEVYLDTDGKASNRAIFDWSGREVSKKSYEVGTSLLLGKGCEIYIDSTGDTLYSQYVNLVVSSGSD